MHSREVLTVLQENKLYVNLESVVSWPENCYFLALWLVLMIFKLMR